MSPFLNLGKVFLNLEQGIFKLLYLLIDANYNFHSLVWSWLVARLGLVGIVLWGGYRRGGGRVAHGIVLKLLSISSEIVGPRLSDVAQSSSVRVSTAYRTWFGE